MKDKIRARKHRLPRKEYIGKKDYTVTTDTFERKPLFLDPRNVDFCVGILRDVADDYLFDVIIYCFMPDHLHLLIRGNSAISNMLDFAKIFKQRTGFHYPDKVEHPLWMKDYYDHIIRNGQDFDEAVSYIANNPVRAGLVDDPLDYPNLGSFGDDVEEIIKV